MFLSYIFWFIETIYPKDIIPHITPDKVTEVDSLIETLDTLKVSKIEELNHNDYSNEVSLYTDTFEDLFRRLDEFITYLDVNEIQIPIRTNHLSLVSYTLGCKRDYPTFKDLIDIFIDKSLTLLYYLYEQSDDCRRYQIKKLNFLLNDIDTIIQLLNQRKDKHTLSY